MLFDLVQGRGFFYDFFSMLLERMNGVKILSEILLDLIQGQTERVESRMRLSGEGRERVCEREIASEG